MEVAPNCASFALFKLGVRKSDTSLGYTPSIGGLEELGLRRSAENEADAVVVVSKKTSSVLHMAVFNPSDRTKVEEREGVGKKPRTISLSKALEPYENSDYLEIVYLKNGH